jgi:hypothetical protein
LGFDFIVRNPFLLKVKREVKDRELVAPFVKKGERQAIKIIERRNI